jgi:hypothetical protein
MRLTSMKEWGSYEFATSIKIFGACAILDEGYRRWLARKPPHYNVLTGFVPSSIVCRLSHGHRCLPAGDSTPMMPPPTFIEPGTDPIFVTYLDG